MARCPGVPAVDSPASASSIWPTWRPSAPDDQSRPPRDRHRLNHQEGGLARAESSRGTWLGRVENARTV